MDVKADTYKVGNAPPPAKPKTFKNKALLPLSPRKILEKPQTWASAWRLTNTLFFDIFPQGIVD